MKFVISGIASALLTTAALISPHAHGHRDLAPTGQLAQASLGHGLRF